MSRYTQGSSLFIGSCLAWAAMAAAAASPPAPPQMAALYPRIGTWKVVTRTPPGPDSPKGGLDQGTAVIRKGPGGFSLVQDFSAEGDGGHVVGQSYTWWDGEAKTYKSVWCDNQQGCLEFATAVNGNSWTVALDGVQGGKKIHTVIRASMSADRNAIHEETASSYDGGPARTEAISDYQRVAH